MANLVQAGRHGAWRHGLLLAAAPIVVLGLAGDRATAAASQAAQTVSTLARRDLSDLPGKEALLLSVEYLPSGASLAHRHDADVFVYVLQGQVVMQVAGQAPQTLSTGATFYEGPVDVHLVSANASAVAPAKLLVFMVKNKGSPVSVALPHAAGGAR
jgi:quercetin dioxygenase-like cupin family protein